MKRLFLFIPLLTMFHMAISQDVLLKQDVDKDTLVRKVGPSHLFHLWICSYAIRQGSRY